MKYLPYSFDEKYEFRTFRNVGKDYDNNTKICMAGNIRRSFHRIINEKEKKYCICDTYLQWKKYVKNSIKSRNINKDNYMHWLIKKQRYYEIRLETVKLVLIPLYILLLTILAEIENMNFLYAIIFVETIMCVWLVADTQKINFYKDYSEIVRMEDIVINNETNKNS